MERGISGYNILTLLAMVDNKIHPNEDLVIRNWLIKEFNFSKNLDSEVETLINLKKTDYLVFLQQQMDLFYTNSTIEERNNLLQFAVNIIKADGIIKKGENKLFDYVYHGWNEEE